MMRTAVTTEVGMHQRDDEVVHDGVNGTWSMDFPAYTPVQLFALAADIESYPRFVPWCIATRILERHSDHWLCDNVFGKGPLRLRFQSRARFEPDSAIAIVSNDGPFRDFQLHWRFIPVDQGCRVEAAFAMRFRSDLLGLLARISVGEVERRIVAAFHRRANALYGAAE